MNKKVYYKLTDKNNRTHGGMVWGVGVTHTAPGQGKQLCSNDVIHVYDHPLKAAFFNPIHARFSSPVLWKVSVKDVVADDSCKVGVKSCTTEEKIPLPEISTNQRIRVAILIALQICKDEPFTKWAFNWLNKTDRSFEAAEMAAEAASWADEMAAVAASWAARTAEAASWAASRAAWAAAEAARVATEAADKIDIAKIIQQAIEDEPC